MFRRRATATTVTALAALAAVGALALPGGGAAALGKHRHPEPSAAVVLAWERTAIRTIYTENAKPIPVGVLYLGFTSLAMYDAARAADRRHASPEAAVAAAAHDVLAEYFTTPTSTANLARDLVNSLDDVPDGYAEQKGVKIGQEVAARLIDERADDGRDDTSIVYAKAPGPGVWQPATGGTMAFAWLGFVDPLLMRRPVRLDGPDALTSRQYARDYLEVKEVGAATGADRTPRQTDTASFFNSSAAIMVTEGLLGNLEAVPRELMETARLFAVMHVAMTDSIIEAWRLKFDVGFWRPSHAIPGAGTDGNPATVADPTWRSFLATPSYSDYVSGHGAATSPATEVIRQLLGEETELTLHSSVTNTDRTYQNLSMLERDAFHSRIWGGLHYRTAMEDAYELGYETAERVLHRLP